MDVKTDPAVNQNDSATLQPPADHGLMNHDLKFASAEIIDGIGFFF